MKVEAKCNQKYPYSHFFNLYNNFHAGGVASSKLKVLLASCITGSSQTCGSVDSDLEFGQEVGWVSQMIINWNVHRSGKEIFHQTK